MPKDQWKKDLEKARAKRARKPPKDTTDARKQALLELSQAKNPRIMFGKHRGKRINSVPRSYLEWLVDPKSSDVSRETPRSLAFKEAVRSFLSR